MPDYFPARASLFDHRLAGVTNLKIVKFPTYRQPAGRGKLYGRYFLDFPMSLVKSDGVWHEVVTPAQEQLANAEKWYLGGYTYPLTDVEAADLPAQYVEDV